MLFVRVDEADTQWSRALLVVVQGYGAPSQIEP